MEVSNLASPGTDIRCGRVTYGRNLLGAGRIEGGRGVRVFKVFKIKSMEYISIGGTNIELAKIPEQHCNDYRAGSDGRIYSNKRYMGGGKSMSVEWRALSQTLCKDTGYFMISISDKGYRKQKTVHTLVCAAWHGARPGKHIQVRHLDGNRINNLPNNLKWGTQEENWEDRKMHGRGMEGEKHFASKLSDVEREHIRWAVGNGFISGNRLAKMLGMSQSAIQAICAKDLHNLHK